MPPPKLKQTKGNPAKKEHIAEKVKEIQMRQKNWMRQRDQQLNTAPEPVSNEASTNEQHWTSSAIGTKKTADRRDSIERTSHGADILRVHHDSSQHLASQVSDKLNVKVKHGFGAWLQSRKEADDTEDQNHSKDHPSGINSNTNHFQEDISTLVSDGGSSLRQSGRNYPLSPADFDSLADSIAAKVKKDLGIKNGSGTRLYDGAETVDERLARGKTFVQGSDGEQTSVARKAGGSDGVDDGGDAHVDVSCHQCPFCSSLMATAAHAPMLLVPCGHNVCKRCACSHTSCRLCGTRVESQTTNIMLQQIIQGFHSRGTHHSGAGSSSLSATSQSTWERGNYHQSQGTLQTTAKQVDVSYSHQLQSLRERQATLQEEARSRKRERDRVASKVKRAEKQVNAIEKEEESMERQIQQLQEQLQGLQEHKEEYCGEYRQLQEDLRTAEDQTALVEQCLKSLGEEVDKVQFLAEGQEDSKLHRRSQYR